MELSRRKKSLTLCLYGFYFIFVEMILMFLKAEKPSQFINDLGQWTVYVAVTGYLIGIYLSFSAFVLINERTFIAPTTHRYQKWVGYYVSMFVQMIWMILPIDLIKYGKWLNEINHLSLTFCVFVLLTLAMCHRNRLSLSGALQ